MPQIRELLRGSLLSPNKNPEEVEMYIDRPEVIIEAFADGDTTPSVLSSVTSVFKTANTSATTITTFDDGRVGQVVDIIVGDSNTTFDFSGGGNLVNGNGADVTPSSGNQMKAIYDGTNWFCIGTGEVSGINIVEDTTPQLGGQLDVNGQSIKFDDNEDIIFGTGDDVRIDWNGYHLIIGGVTSSGYIHVIERTLKMMNSDASMELALVHNGSNGYVGTGVNSGPLLLGHQGTPTVKTQSHLASGNTSGATLINHAAADVDIGFNLLPSFNFNASDTLEARHCGAITGKTDTSSYTLTGPTSSDTDFPVGGVATVANFGSSTNYSLADTASCTMYICDGSSVSDISGSAALAPGGMITLYRYSTSAIYITGSGVS